MEPGCLTARPPSRHKPAPQHLNLNLQSTSTEDMELAREIHTSDRLGNGIDETPLELLIYDMDVSEDGGNIPFGGLPTALNTDADCFDMGSPKYRVPVIMTSFEMKEPMSADCYHTTKKKSSAANARKSNSKTSILKSSAFQFKDLSFTPSKTKYNPGKVINSKATTNSGVSSGLQLNTENKSRKIAFDCKISGKAINSRRISTAVMTSHELERKNTMTPPPSRNCRTTNATESSRDAFSKRSGWPFSYLEDDTTLLTMGSAGFVDESIGQNEILLHADKEKRMNLRRNSKNIFSESEAPSSILYSNEDYDYEEVDVDSSSSEEDFNAELDTTLEKDFLSLFAPSK
jgi:hypothetical protein